MRLLTQHSIPSLRQKKQVVWLFDDSGSLHSKMCDISHHVTFFQRSHKCVYVISDRDSKKLDFRFWGYVVCCHTTQNMLHSSIFGDISTENLKDSRWLTVLALMLDTLQKCMWFPVLLWNQADGGTLILHYSFLYIKVANVKRVMPDLPSAFYRPLLTPLNLLFQFYGTIWDSGSQTAERTWDFDSLSGILIILLHMILIWRQIRQVFANTLAKKV